MMVTIAVLGAGELGATIARLIAELGLARRVVMVDADLGKAQGKALDLAQSGPVEGYDTRVEGCAELKAVGPADVVIVADPPDLTGRVLDKARAGDFVRAVAPDLGRGVLLVAAADAPSLVEAAVHRGIAREGVLGSASVALAGCLRRRLAAELQAEPGEVSISVLGYPPEHVLIPQGSATLGGVPIEKLSAVACRRALEAGRRRTLGPVSLATAAVRVLRALAHSRGTVLPVVAHLDGEYGHRGVALAVPARLGSGRLEGIVEFALEPVDRVALDTAAQRRFEAG